LENKIFRAVELQSSQVLQTGTLTLNDKAANARFAMDFKPKATHFPTVATAWTNAAADPLNDIDSLADTIRSDGLVDIDTLVMGASAFENFINDEKVKLLLDNRRYELGEVAPQVRGRGAKYQARITYKNYQYEIWTYNGRYTDPATGNSTKYVDDDKVIMLSQSASRFDLTLGSIPLITAPDPRVAAFMPRRVGSIERGMMMTVNPWVTPNNKHIKLEVGVRPLTIPVGIDTYGCLTTV
jgi:hypothetical protein